jgi:beta-1,4-mannosyl-glycoprotein beta-1,4-N-acetylglucosaminyltransferase
VKWEAHIPKVYDCFPFFHELDLLDIRLNELDSVVDRFVLCEAPFTFKGIPEPLHFAENRERFKPFLHKITHVVIDDMPMGKDNASAHWKRQNFQRNAIRRGLLDAEPDDLVILSDVDEIPRATVVSRLAHRTGKPTVFSFEMNEYRLFVNVLRAHSWNRSRMARFGDIRHMERLRAGVPTWRPNRRSLSRTLRQFRRMSFGMRRLRPWVIVPDAGWHFSDMGGPDKVVHKFDAVSETRSESASSIAGVGKRITHVVKQTTRPRDKSDYRLQELDENFPKYLLENQTRFAHLIADRQTFERYGVTPPD